MKEKRLFTTILQLLLVYILIINISVSENYFTKTDNIKNEEITSIVEYEYFYAMTSWYGAGFQGRKMASGEIFDMNDESIAAHRHLEFGTKLEIINPDNKKIVYVTIKDRGPYIKNREFDISYAAAKKLGIIENGVKKLKIRIIE